MDDEFTLAYAYKGNSDRFPSMAKQIKLLEELGFDQKTTMETDRHRDENERDVWIKKIFDRPGILVIAFPQVLGSGKRRNKLLRELAGYGTKVQVGPGEPVLYDTEEKVKAFAKIAVQEARVESGRVLGTKHAKGRPVLYTLEGRKFTADEQKAILGAAWHDESVAGRRIAQRLARLLSGYVWPPHGLKSLLGNRHDKKD